MSREALLRLLQHRIGLESDTLGERVLLDAFAESRAALGVTSDETLYGKALSHPGAFGEIVERFVVPESWFFRAGDQYVDLVRFAGEQRNRRPLRILSLPCASGEEAYSAVIVLVEAGLRPEDVQVLGIDISRSAIERAQAGVYRPTALRGRAPVEPWMVPQAGGFSVAAGIRRCVRFRIGNALDPMLFDPSERFDVVFCRNLLIYLHPDARARVLRALLGVLEPRGLLFAGQAEVLNASSELRPYEGGCPLSYIREPAAGMADPAEAATHPNPGKAAKAARAPVPPAKPQKPAKIVEPTPQALADAGRLDEARDACARRLELHPEEIDTLFLLGLVEAARNDLRAADAAFARVCFLDRDHVAAIDHRIALAERLDHPEQARDLRKRAQRLRERLGRSP